jgi:cytochrome P450
MTSRTALPPGPRLPALAQTALWFGRPIRFMEWCRRRYGDCVTLRLSFGPAMVMVSDPALVDGILAAPPAVAPTGPENAILEPMLGPNSVLMLDGPEHLRQRRLLLPFFHGVRIVFGLEDEARLAELGELLRRLLALGSSWLVLPFMQHDLGPLSPWGRFVRLKARIDRFLVREVRERRADPSLGTRDDVLSQLLQARDEDGDQLTDEELRDELMTLLVAGHETTATALAWCFDLVLRRPDLLGEVAGSRKLADAVIRETLRLRAPFRLVSRRLVAPMQVGPYTLPAGVAVGVNVYLTHRRPEVYPDPEAFRPERFMERQPEAWVPFGGGVRRCLGATFATFEMGVVLRTVLGRARLRPASPETDPISLHAVILVPKNGVRVVRDISGSS